MDYSLPAKSQGQKLHRTLPSSRDWRFCSWLLIASLAVQLSTVLLVRQHETVATLEEDEQEYWRLATEFQQHGPSGISARRTLPFPLLIAALRWTVGDDYFRVQLALSTLLSFSPVLFYWLVRRRIADELVARLASVGFVLWPAFVRYDATLYSDSTGMAVFLCFLLAFPISNFAPEESRTRWWQFFTAGALLGLSLQFKPLYMIFVPFAVLLAFFTEAVAKRRLLAISFLLVGAALVLLPWSAYLSEREGRFIAVSANGGETLAGGLNPELLALEKNNEVVGKDGRQTWVGPGKWLMMEKTGYLSEEERHLPYLQASALLRARTHAWVVSHPAQAAYLSARKLLYMWGIYPFWNGVSQTLLGNFPLLLLLAAGSAGLWINRASFRNLAVFWSLPLFVSSVALLSWGSWRFRLPGDMGLIGLTAMLLAGWIRRAQSDGPTLRRVKISFFPGKPTANSASN